MMKNNNDCLHPLSKPVLSVNELTKRYKLLFEALFSIQSVTDNKEREAILTELGHGHFFESTAFFGYFEKAKKSQMVNSNAPRTLLHDQYLVDLWKAAHSQLLTEHTTIIFQHYQLELSTGKPLSHADVKNLYMHSLQLEPSQKESEIALEDLGAILLEPLRKAFKGVK